MLMFYTVQTTKGIIVGKRMKTIVNSYSIVWFSIVGDPKHHKWCGDHYSCCDTLQLKNGHVSFATWKFIFKLI